MLFKNIENIISANINEYITQVANKYNIDARNQLRMGINSFKPPNSFQK